MSYQLIDEKVSKLIMYLICNSCGNIINYSDEIKEIILDRMFKCSCDNFVTMQDVFPSLNSQDFVYSAEVLYENSKTCDHVNLSILFDFLKKDNILIEKTKLDSYINKFEKIRDKFPDNNTDYFLSINDEFESYLRTKESDDNISKIIIGIFLIHKNKFRKPFVIMTLSLIEQLFNDYFNIIIKSKLSSRGANNLLKLYSTSGVSNCLSVLDSFLDEPIKDKMDKYNSGFYDRWAFYRNLRNEIIHNNTKYVSKSKSAETYKLIKTSVDTFAHLKSEIYKF